jgi:hypothetical protein
MIKSVQTHFLQFIILFGFVYSYICFFDKWNWYILYVLNLVQKTQ